VHATELTELSVGVTGRPSNGTVYYGGSLFVYWSDKARNLQSDRNVMSRALFWQCMTLYVQRSFLLIAVWTFLWC